MGGQRNAGKTPTWRETLLESWAWNVTLFDGSYNSKHVNNIRQTAIDFNQKLVSRNNKTNYEVEMCEAINNFKAQDAS